MITEDYVSFETSKLLKEKGFDEFCTHYYLTASDIPTHNRELSEFNNSDLRNAYSAPTLQMAMKWLREKKGIAVIPVLSSVLDNEKFLWDVKVVIAKNYDVYSQGWVYENQEEACEAVIRYCLENLF